MDEEDDVSDIDEPGVYTLSEYKDLVSKSLEQGHPIAQLKRKHVIARLDSSDAIRWLILIQKDRSNWEQETIALSRNRPNVQVLKEKGQG